MKLPDDAVIARDKLTGYLLRRVPENDKSVWLTEEATGTTKFITLYPAKTT